MQAFTSRDSSPGQKHKIKLFDKELTIQIVYRSPSKPTNQTKKYSFNPYKSKISSKNDSKAVNICSSNKSVVREHALTNKSKQFYKNSINEGKTIISLYQQFQRHIAQRKTRGRLKVYSNSKQPQDMNIKRYDPVPVKTITIKKRQQQISPEKQTRKIRLYSNHKDKKQAERHKVSLIDKPSMSAQKQNMTPLRNRKYKLQVTTSKSRGKNDSLFSQRQQFSTQIKKLQLKTLQHPLSGIQVDSYNSSIFH